MLLDPQQLGTLTGAGRMLVTSSASAMSDLSGTLNRPECVGAWTPATEQSYAGSSWTRVNRQVLGDAAEPDSIHRTVVQSVVLIVPVVGIPIWCGRGPIAALAAVLAVLAGREYVRLVNLPRADTALLLALLTAARAAAGSGAGMNRAGDDDAGVAGIRTPDMAQ